MEEIIYRVSLKKNEWEYLCRVFEKNQNLNSTVRAKIQNAKVIKNTEKKVNATKKATATRTARAKEKIQNAINILRLENKPITYYSIRKESGVSHQTIVKYINRNELEKLNTII